MRQANNVLKSSFEGEIGKPLWKPERILEMNDKFAEALRRAIEAGREHCPTAVSTRPGTKHPIVGYSRD
jgi:hypothetical protein